jgi:hypothetical protein
MIEELNAVKAAAEAKVSVAIGEALDTLHKAGLSVQSVDVSLGNATLLSSAVPLRYVTRVTIEARLF